MNFTDQIKEHALKDAPKEACGLVFCENNTYIARPVPNIIEEGVIENPRTAFRMPDDVVLSARRTKTLVGFYHSHTNDYKDFGAADIAIAEANQLPSYLYLVPTDEFKVYYPNGTKVALIDRPYVPLVHDCIEIVRDGLMDLFHIETPPFPRTVEEALTGKKVGLAEYLQVNGFKPVSKARKGDTLALIIRGHNYPNHAGLMISDAQFLHHPLGHRSKIDPYGGSWEKLTCGIFRHISLFNNPERFK